MEDNIYGVFRTEPEQVVYKQILTPEEAITANNDFISEETGWKDGAQVIANGHRPFIDVDLPNKMPELMERLPVILRDYLPDVTVSPDARFYNHQYGRVKPHTDGNRDGVSQYTLLIYLCSEFEGGQLSIKLKRSDEERLAENPYHHHKIFTFTPKCGYGVIFRKSLLHWAEEVVDGNKNFLLIHLRSDF